MHRREKKKRKEKGKENRKSTSKAHTPYNWELKFAFGKGLSHTNRRAKNVPHEGKKNIAISPFSFSFFLSSYRLAAVAIVLLLFLYSAVSFTAFSAGFHFSRSPLQWHIVKLDFRLILLVFANVSCRMRLNFVAVWTKWKAIYLNWIKVNRTQNVLYVYTLWARWVTARTQKYLSPSRSCRATDWKFFGALGGNGIGWWWWLMEVVMEKFIKITLFTFARQRK